MQTLLELETAMYNALVAASAIATYVGAANVNSIGQNVEPDYPCLEYSINQNGAGYAFGQPGITPVSEVILVTIDIKTEPNDYTTHHAIYEAVKGVMHSLGYRFVSPAPVYFDSNLQVNVRPTRWEVINA